jgi:hypothetical protein
MILFFGTNFKHLILNTNLKIMKCLIQTILESNTVVHKVNKIEVIKRYIRMKYKIDISSSALKERIDNHLFHAQMKHAM